MGSNVASKCDEMRPNVARIGLPKAPGLSALELVQAPRGAWTSGVPSLEAGDVSPGLASPGDEELG